MTDYPYVGVLDADYCGPVKLLCRHWCTNNDCCTDFTVGSGLHDESEKQFDYGDSTSHTSCNGEGK